MIVGLKVNPNGRSSILILISKMSLDGSVTLGMTLRVTLGMMLGVTLL